MNFNIESAGDEEKALHLLLSYSTIACVPGKELVDVDADVDVDVDVAGKEPDQPDVDSEPCKENQSRGGD